MEFLYNFHLIIFLLGALISSLEPVTSSPLANGGNGETASDRFPDRKRSNGFPVISSINDQPFNQQDGIPSLSRSRGNTVQKFAIEPVDKSAIIGKTVILPCRVLHKVGPLQWTRDGFGLGPDRNLEGFSRYKMIGSDEEGDFSLKIQSVTLEDDAIYQCQVGAAEGVDGIRSRNAVLTVFVPPEPPKIVQGDRLSTTAGLTVELTCESYGGKPAAELTWLDGEGNPVTTGIEHQTQILSDGKRANSILKWTFIPGREHHGKTFTCRAENSALQHPQKAQIRVEVKYKPEIQLTPDKSSYMEGDDVKLSCKALANPDDLLIYKWYRNGELVHNDRNVNMVITQVKREMNGSPITCEVSNAVGISKETYSLDIHFGPVFRSPKEDVHAAVEGETVKLKCDPSGNPKPEIAWLYNGSTKVLSTNKELVIPSMSEDKSGRYVCRASVQGFPEVSSSTHVFIKGPPKIMSPSMQYIVDDEPVKVECIVHSVPLQSKVIWMRNSQVIDIDNGHIEMIEDKKPLESITRNILLIHKRSDEFFGEYNCSVWNEYGSDQRIIRISKQKSLPMLIIIAAIIGIIVAVVSITIIVILCMKRKSNPDGDDYLSDVKKEASNGTTNKTSSTTHSTKTLDNSSITLTSNGTSAKHLQPAHHILAPSPQQHQQFQNLYLQQVSYQQFQPLYHNVVDTGSVDSDFDLKFGTHV